MLDIEIIQEIIYSLAVTLFLIYLSRLPKYSLFVSSLVFVLLLLGINLIPLYRGSSLIELLRGVVGDVSIASGGLLLMIIAHQFDFRDTRRPLLNLSEKISLVVLGLVLYLSTFGFISFDLYHLGYLSPLMLFCFSGITFGLILTNRRLGYLWLFSIIGFYFRWQASNNLWDYLYDPVLCLVLIFVLIKELLAYLYSPRRSHKLIL